MECKIAVVGTGYVGLSLDTLLSQRNEVTTVDLVSKKVDLINNHNIRLVDAAHTFVSILQQSAEEKNISNLFMGFTEAKAIKLFANMYLGITCKLL